MKIIQRRHRTIIGMLFHSIQKLHLLQLLLLSANGFLDLPTRTISTPLQSMEKTTMLFASNAASSTNDNDNTAAAATTTHHHCRNDDDDKCTPRRRSLRRKIPYVESFEEQIARELWEKNPFRGVEHIVDTIIGSGSDGDGNCNCDRNTTEFQASSILTPIKSAIPESFNRHDDNPTSPLIFPSLSGYEDSFDPLYNRTTGDDVDVDVDPNNKNGGNVTRSSMSGTSIIGTAFVATSPFAVIVDNNETKKEKLNHFCLRVAYKGEDFCGWQTQLNNFEKPSVQRTLEEWLTELQNDQPLDAERNAEMKRSRRLEKREGKDDTATTTRSGDESYNANANANNNTSNHNTAAPKNNNNNNNNNNKLAKKIKWADLPVAGRTDSGVSAIGQLCRFRTYRKDLTAERIKTYLNNDKVRNDPRISQSLRVTEITRVSKAFHPTFTTSCRAYAYMIDINSNNSEADQYDQSSSSCSSSSSSSSTSSSSTPGTFTFDLLGDERAEQQVALLDSMLRTLEGKRLDYIGLSYGKVKTLNTLCTLYHARARLVEYEKRTESSPVTASASAAGVQQQPPTHTTTKAVCIELVGDRFLRRMVRLLVEASVRLVATADADDNDNDSDENNGCGDAERAKDADALLLLKLIEKHDRTLVGRPAPPDGLLFVGARVQSN
jgi:tRNA U38,U39,U40 pseudouridine synthase TruA